MKKLMIVSVALALAGCTSVPPQVAQTHQMEGEIIEGLQTNHLALVDVYVDQKLAGFETFFFQQYGPAFRTYWMDEFKSEKGRDYDPEKDFPRFYEDLTAVYLDAVKPIEKTRSDLKDAIKTEYGNAIAAHEAVGEWMDNLKQLTDAQHAAVDHILSAAKPGLSLDAVDNAVTAAKSKVQLQMDSF